MIKFILLFVFTFNVFAQNTVLLNKGESAPFDGVLSDSDQMKIYRQSNEEKKLLQDKVLTLKDLNATIQERSDVYKAEGDYYRSQLRTQEFRGFWANVGYFALGVLATSLAIKASENVR